jgi:hypothetical protein
VENNFLKGRYMIYIISLKELIFYLVGSKLFFGMCGQIMHTLGENSAASGSEQRTSVWQEGERWLQEWRER